MLLFGPDRRLIWTFCPVSAPEHQGFRLEIRLSRQKKRPEVRPRGAFLPAHPAFSRLPAALSGPLRLTAPGLTARVRLSTGCPAFFPAHRPLGFPVSLPAIPPEVPGVFPAFPARCAFSRSARLLPEQDASGVSGPVCSGPGVAEFLIPLTRLSLWHTALFPASPAGFRPFSAPGGHPVSSSSGAPRCVPRNPQPQPGPRVHFFALLCERAVYPQGGLNLWGFSPGDRRPLSRKNPTNSRVGVLAQLKRKSRRDRRRVTV